MSKQLVQSVGANYLVNRSDSEVTKDVGKVMMLTGGGGIVTLGVLSVIPFLPILLLILAAAGLVVWVKGNK